MCVDGNKWNCSSTLVAREDWYTEETREREFVGVVFLGMGRFRYSSYPPLNISPEH